MRIILRHMDGSETSLAVQGHHRLHIMKSQLCAKLGVTLARVRLIFGTQVLQSDATAAAVGLEDGAVVNVVVLPPLFKGSQVYEKVAEAFAGRQAERISEAEVDGHMEQFMERKVHLHEALARRNLLKVV